MNNLVNELCGTYFMPHGQCYLWSPWLISLHTLGDSLIALSYFSIPAMLIYFARKRPDLPYRSVLLLFGAFIVACGTTHALEVWTIWRPAYLLTGLVKLLTAAISLVTAGYLVKIIPRALQLPSADDLRKANENLEQRVQQRTADLEAANDRLRQEITQREEAEAAVQALNDKLSRRVNELQTLLDLLPVGVGVADDADCLVIRSNPALAQMLSVPPTANASLSGSDAPEHFRVLHNGNPLEAHQLPMQVAARENRPVVDFEVTIEFTNGHRVDVLTSAIPLRDSQGAAIGCVATFQNITGLKAASEANAHYAAIINWSKDAIISKTLEGVITSWNKGAETIFGYTAEEIIGQPISLLFPKEKIHEEAAILSRIQNGKTVEHFETTRRHKDGHFISVSVSISPIRDTSGKICGASKIARDITALKELLEERRKLERKILETQKLESLGVLAGGIAHDFNNLLTGILGNASLARMDLPPSSSILPMLAQIELSAQRAAELCKQMLAYSGKGRFVVQPLDLNSLVEETMHLLNMSISKHCVPRFNLLPNLPAIQADTTQIRQIIMNLVINASEAIGERSGVIAISTGLARVDEDYLSTLLVHDNMATGDYVFIEISDNGAGMDAATLNKIFDPFFTTKFTGRGLGLAAVLGIIRGHGGGLKVYSEKGRGTTFKALFPCLEKTMAAPITRSAQADNRWRGHGTVLIVDDEETVRSVCARMVEAMGFQCILALDGRDAVEKYRAEPARYNLVLLDLTMPHLDGEETFRQLRHLNPGVRVILMSGFNQEEAGSRFIGKGLAGFVQKPFEVEKLIDIIRTTFLQS